MAELNLLPETLVAGETVSVAVSLPLYTAASGWAVAYRFAATTPFSVSCTGGTDGAWTLALTSAQTLSLKTGGLRFDAIATQTVGEAVAQVVAVDSGTITVTASPLLVSQWEAVLTAVDAAIESWGTSNQRSMTIEGMSVSYRSIDELFNLRSFCVLQIQRERGGRGRKVIYSRFNLA